MNLLLTTETVVFSDDYVWSLLIQIAILAVALLLGNFLRTKIPFIRSLLMPSALIGGLLIFIAKLIPGVKQYINVSVMQVITYHCLGLGFAALSLVTKQTKTITSKVKIVESGVIMAGSYLIQAIFGLVISIGLYFAIGSFYGAGLVLPMGYGQGTGSALSWGATFETSYGFSGGASFGLTIATIGFLVASIVGVIYMNILKFKGKIKVRAKRFDQKAVTDFEHENEIPNSESVDKMTIQVCFIIFVYLVAYGFMNLLKLTNIGVLNDLAWGLNFLWALLFAFVFKKVMGLLRRKKIVTRFYINNYLMERVSGLMFDLMIISGVAAIEFDDIVNNWLLLTLTCVIGAVVTFFYVYKATKYTYKNYEAESFLCNFGTVTGTVSNGMILLREIDPNYDTPAATNIVLQNIPSVIMLAPLLLTLGFAAKSLTNTFIALGLYVVLFVGYNVFLFRRKIFKKYRAIPEQEWVEPAEGSETSVASTEDDVG